MLKSVVLALLVAFAISQQQSAPADLVTSLPGFQGSLPTRHYSGYITVNSTTNTRLFYWFVEAINATSSTPIVVWANGGPGCSSMIGFFLENGPFHVNVSSADGSLILSLNNRSWSNTGITHMLYVDAPYGTGFSQASDQNLIPTSDFQAASHMIQFLNGFFTLHPDLATQPVWLGAEGEASRIMMSAAYRIMIGKQQQSTVTSSELYPLTVPLKIPGMILESGLIEPLIQYNVRPQQAYYSGLISSDTMQKMIPLQLQCARDIQNGRFNEHNSACTILDLSLKLSSGGMSFRDIRQFGQFPKQPIDLLFVKYLNQLSVQQALHIDPVVNFEPCSAQVEINLSNNSLQPIQQLLAPLLSFGLRIFMLHGNFDMYSGPVGMEQVLRNIPSLQFNQAPRNLVFIGNEVTGYVNELSNGLTFMVMAGTSHYVTHEHPGHTVSMINYFLNNMTFCSDDRIGEIPRIQLANGLEMILEPVDNSTSKDNPDFQTWNQPIDSSQIGQPPQLFKLQCKVAQSLCTGLLNNCSGVGTCNNGACVCPEGYTGSICSFRITNMTTSGVTVTQQQSNEWYYIQLPPNQSTNNALLSLTTVTSVTPIGDEDIYDTGDQTIHNIGDGIAIPGLMSNKLCLYAKKGALPTQQLFDSAQCVSKEDLGQIVTLRLPPISQQGDWFTGVFNGLANIEVSYPE